MSVKKLESSVVLNLKKCLWGGTDLKQDVFSRWSQGFVFSDTTPAALVQYHGGPCAVLVPVQAYIVKAALFQGENPSMDYLTNISSRKEELLLEALLDILTQLTDSQKFIIVGYQASSASTSSSEESQNHLSQSNHGEISEDLFHSNLVINECSSISDLTEVLRSAIPSLQSQYGVLTYLYSILLTKDTPQPIPSNWRSYVLKGNYEEKKEKSCNSFCTLLGIDQIKNEVEDSSEPLIDGTHGHGSQSLINLLLTSKATSNVWDDDKEIAGLKLCGIQRQSSIGFLTILEHMRYCEVGWYLKNPKYPIWVIGSETHLTLLFSPDVNLIVRDSPEIAASLVFSRFDPESNGFISKSLLGDLMAALDLVSEKEYVDIMASKLDSEDFGIITRSSFMEEFFPLQSAEQPREFTLYHYNGLPQSCANGQVTFLECKAILADEIDTQFITDTSPIKLCIQTKWPSIELSWASTTPPSLN